MHAHPHLALLHNSGAILNRTLYGSADASERTALAADMTMDTAGGTTTDTGAGVAFDAALQNRDVVVSPANRSIVRAQSTPDGDPGTDTPRDAIVASSDAHHLTRGEKVAAGGAALLALWWIFG